jgi:hypothetical protein
MRKLGPGIFLHALRVAAMQVARWAAAGVVLLLTLEAAHALVTPTINVTSSLNPAMQGQSVTFTATVTGSSGTPTGSVTFEDNGAILGTIPLTSGVAAYATPSLTIGNHVITVIYTGDSTYQSTGTELPQTQVITGTQATTTALSSSSNPSTLGQSVTFTATVTSAGGTPTGTVTFVDGGSMIGTGTLSGGVASFTTTGLALGTHNITATYSAQGNFLGSTSLTLTQTVNRAPTTTSLTSSSNPSTVGQTITLTATVVGSGGSTTGTVTFMDGAATLGTSSTTNGIATLTTSSLGTGSHSLTAVYSGNGGFLGSTSAALTQTVNQTTSTPFITSTANPSTFGQPVTFNVSVSSVGGITPTGTVTFMDGGSGIGTSTLSNGATSFTTSQLTAGSHSITALYHGDANFLSASSSVLPQAVSQAASATALTSSINPSTAGQAVTFTATVTAPGGTPTGIVTFKDGATTLGTGNLAGGVATFTTPSLALGSHTITAVYAGASGFQASTSAPITQTVNQAGSTTVITSTLNPSTFGQSITFNVTVTGSGGTPTGAVTFLDGSAAIGSGALNGSGMTSFTTSSLAVGSHTITATYGGNAAFTTSSAQLTQNVNKGATTTALTSSVNPSAPGQAVTFTATVGGGGGTPTGTVTFKDGGTTVGTGTLSNGAASVTTSSLTTGNHSITAAYGGNGSFAASTSPALMQAVAVPADSVKLREMQISTTPMIAQISGQSITGAADAAVAAGFGGTPQMLTPNGSGFTYYFNGETTAENDPDRDSLKRYLEAPDGSNKRVDQSFQALGYAAMPVKASPPAPPASASRDWLAWIDFRGTDFYRGTVGNDLKGVQVNAVAGITHLITSNFLVGALGGYEHFDYNSQAFNGVLHGDGVTAGAYLGWRITSNLRFNATAAWSDIFADNISGGASGSFVGSRWLAAGGLTGTYPWRRFVLEPSAQVYALWEHESAYTDSLGTQQGAREFETGRASAGAKISYPLPWQYGVNLSPYVGLYGDYYFSGDDASVIGLTTVPLLQGWSARATGGVAATLAGGAQVAFGAELGGLGIGTYIWTLRLRGSVPF